MFPSNPSDAAFFLVCLCVALAGAVLPEIFRARRAQQDFMLQERARALREIAVLEYTLNRARAMRPEESDAELFRRVLPRSMQNLIQDRPRTKR